MLTRDALLAYAHYICIIAFACLLVSELALLRSAMPPGQARRIQVLDRWYGIVAGLLVLSGLARLNFGLKGAAFYVHNPVFWTKIGLFVLVGLISIAPTIAFIRWHARLASDGSLVLDAGEFRRIRGLLSLQVVLLLLIPLCAVFMARGV